MVWNNVISQSHLLNENLGEFFFGEGGGGLTVMEMNKFAGGTVAELSIKILAHREGVQ